ncbi:MAG: hypothetical protein FJ265_15765 [Planctomycetes bacterium]|nr:hypothetical protein [Planctomycetota bacterium]
MPILARGSCRCPPVVWLCLAGACGSTPATPEQQRAAEQRLLAPFLRDVEVGCRELVVEATGNFYRNVGQPAVDVRAHLARKERGDGYVDTIWTNRLGEPRTSFVVTIGEPDALTEQGIVRRPRTVFTVVNQVRVRFYEDARPLLLSARTAGGFAVVREDKASPARDLTEYAVEDGAVRCR